MTEKSTPDEVLFDECVYLCQNHLASSIAEAAALPAVRRRRLIDRSVYLKALERRQLIEAIVGCFRGSE